MPDTKARPSRDIVLMATAGVWSQRSTCSRAHVGAVIATDTGRILMTGYNGAPAGMAHCDHTCDCGAIIPPENDTFTIVLTADGPEAQYDSGPSTWRNCTRECASQAPCKLAVHAEANAIACAARYGVNTQGTDLFVTMSPCYACAQLIINAGIVRVAVGELYRDPAGYNLLIGAGIEVDRIQ